MSNIKFGNIDFSGDGAYIWGAGQYSAPARSIEKVSVAGRSGDLIIDNGKYNNITVRYGVAITKDIPKNTDRLKYLLYSQKGYQRLYDSDRKNFYREACFYGGFDLSEIKAGIVYVDFDCKPYLYDITSMGYQVLSGETIEIYNKYFEPSRPNFILNTNGSGTINIENENHSAPLQTMRLENAVTNTFINTELQEAYVDVDGIMQNVNSTVSGTDIVLPYGNSEITNNSSAVITILPTWRTI